MCSARVEPVAPGATISDLMSILAGRYPLVRERVYDPKRTRFNPCVLINYNDRVINPKIVREQALEDGDKVTVFPVYSGG